MAKTNQNQLPMVLPNHKTVKIGNLTIVQNTFSGTYRGKSSNSSHKVDYAGKTRAISDDFGNYSMNLTSSFKVVIKGIEQPFSNKLDDELDWICNCFGFLGGQDDDKNAGSVFKEIVRSVETGKPHTSTSLAKTLGTSRGAVINHLKHLLRAGLISRNGKFYFPRSKSMLRTIKEVQEDIDRVFKRMEETAKRIDKEFGINIDD